LIKALFGLQAAASTETASAGNAPLALLVVLVAAVGWFGLRTLVRTMRAGKVAAAVGGSFNDFACEALVNASKLDGRIDERERTVIRNGLREIGVSLSEVALEAAFTRARLSKNELVAYMAAKAGVFTRDQKAWLLKTLFAVFVADGRFEEQEHAALVDYTAAIGFDREKAPEVLRQFARHTIT
jgi:uncharacterized membrane protein YebE (DUF533 family)